MTNHVSSPAPTPAEEPPGKPGGWGKRGSIALSWICLTLGIVSAVLVVISFQNVAAWRTYAHLAFGLALAGFVCGFVGAAWGADASRSLGGWGYLRWLMGFGCCVVVLLATLTLPVHNFGC